MAEIQGSSCVDINSIITYSTQEVTGANYEWSVSKGTIVEGQGTNQISVRWDQRSAGEVGRVSVIIDNGSDNRDNGYLEVNIVDIQDNPIEGPTDTSLNKTETYGVASYPDSSYHWILENGIIEDGQRGAEVQIKWTSSGEGYLRMNEVMQDGCERSSVLTVNISDSEDEGPQPNISGSQEVCRGEQETYSTPLNSGNSYSWNVTGGEIVSGNETNSITVNWEEEGSGTVEVTEEDSNGLSGSDSLSITVNPNPSPSITGPSEVCANTTANYSISGNEGSEFNWLVEGGTIINGEGTDSVTVEWDSSGSGSVEVTETNSSGCSTTDSLSVTINANPSPSISGPDTVGETKKATYSVTSHSGSSYSWTVNGGTVISGSGTHEITVEWGTEGSGSVSVTETDANGCSGSDTLSITIESVPNPSISGPSNVGEQREEFYSVTEHSGHSYSWTVNGGSIVSGAGTHTITVHWGDQGSGSVQVDETNESGYTGSDSLDVTINSVPNPSISGASDVDDQSEEIYSVSANFGSTYDWTVSGGNIQNGQGTHEITVLWGTGDSGSLYVEETNSEGYTGSDSFSVTIHEGPTPAIDGPEEVEEEQTATYLITYHQDSTYSWSVEGGTIQSGQNTHEIEVEWGAEGTGTVEVTETDVDGYSSTETLSITIQQKDSTMSSKNVNGSIKDKYGYGQSGLTVEAFDKTFGSEKKVGSTQTDSNGNYQINYTKDDLNNDGCNEGQQKETGDFIVKARDSEGNTIGQSPLFLGSKNQQTINVHTGNESFVGSSKFKVSEENISNFLPNGMVDLANKSVQDFHFLKTCTKETARSTADNINAHNTSSKLGGNQDTKETLFGLLSMGGQKSPMTAIAQDKNTNIEFLKEAARSNIIDPQKENNASNLIDDLINKVSNNLQNNFDSTSQLGQIYSEAGLTAEERNTALDVTAHNFNKSASTVFQAMRDQGISDSVVQNLEKLNNFQKITGNNTDLTIHLNNRDDVSTEADLTQFNKTDWSNMLDQEGISIPDYVQGDTDEKGDNYIKAIQRRAEDSHPTKFFVERMKEDGNYDSTDFETFIGNNPDFDILNDNVNKYLEENTNVLDGISNPDDFKEELRTHQRLYRLCPKNDRYRCVKIMRDGGLTSAQDISAMGKDSFMGEFGEALGTNPVADRVFAKSEINHTAALSIYFDFNQLTDSDNNVIQSGGIGDVNDALSETAKNVFKDNAYCSCKHCRSVLSPAAYLVDQLMFLKDEKADTDELRDEFLTRRPEIAKVDLNCHNTNTPMPYIDIVNEVLENEILENENPGEVNYDRQTTWKAEALRAMPEHLQRPAYDILQTAIYPWFLPFNLNLEETRTYLKQLNIGFHELLHKLPGNSNVKDIHVAIEILGITNLERGIITNNDSLISNYLGTGTSLDEYYNNNSETDLESDIPLLLEVTNLTYEELTNYLHSEFINPHNVSVQFDDIDKCSLEKATLNLSGSDSVDLDRFHRFARLRQATGWTVFELDRSIAAFNNGNAGQGSADIDDTLLKNIRYIHEIKSATEINHLELLSFWGPLDTYLNEKGNALYDDLFLNTSASELTDDIQTAFELNQNRDGLANIGDSELTGTLDEAPYFHHISGALAIESKDLAFIIQNEFPNDSDQDITLANLSHLNRVVKFVKALDITVEEFYSFLNIITYDPFADPASTKNFVDDVKMVKGSPFSIHELDYLLANGDLSKNTEQALVNKDIRKYLEGLRDTLNSKLKEIDKILEKSDKIKGTEQLLSRYLDDEDFKKVLPIISGETTLPESEQKDIISNNLSEFLVVNNAEDKLIYEEETEYLATKNERFAYVYNAFAPFFENHFKEEFLKDIVYQYWAEAFEVPYKDVEALLQNYLVFPESDSDQDINKPVDWYLTDDFLVSTFSNESGSTDTASEVDRETFSEQYQLTERLHKTTLILQKLGFHYSDEEAFFLNELDDRPALTDGHFFELLLGAQKPSHWLDLTNLPVSQPTASGTTTSSQELKTFGSWKPLYQMKLFDERYFINREFSSLWLLKGAYDQNFSQSEFLEELSNSTNWNETDLSELSGSNGFAHQLTDFRDEKPYLELADAFELLNRLQTSAQKALDWKTYDPDGTVANEIINTVKAKYSLDRWYEIAPPLRDELREKQRDALQAYIIANYQYMQEGETQDFEKPIDLYSRLLIDTEMTACKDTTRILVANLSIQHFITRLQLGLEDPFLLPKYKKEEWQWRKNYRIWEANRKVFMYPENYMDAGVRDDKSNLFQEFEKKIQAENPTDQRVRSAYLDYLRELDKMAHMEIMGMCQDDDPRKNIYYVFARTQNTPHTYYFRKWVDDSYWTPWEKIELKINAYPHQLVPYVYNGQLFLFWPEIIDKSKQPEDKDQNTKHQEGRKDSYIYLYWTFYIKNEWVEPKRSDSAIKVEDSHNETEGGGEFEKIGLGESPQQLYLRADKTSNNDLVIHTFISSTSTDWKVNRHDSFIFSGTQFKPQVYKDAEEAFMKVPEIINGMAYFNAFKAEDHDGVTINMTHYVKVREDFELAKVEDEDLIRSELSSIRSEDLGKFETQQNKIIKPGFSIFTLFPHETSNFITSEPFFVISSEHTLFTTVRTEEIEQDPHEVEALVDTTLVQGGNEVVNFSNGYSKSAARANPATNQSQRNNSYVSSENMTYSATTKVNTSYRNNESAVLSDPSNETVAFEGDIEVDIETKTSATVQVLKPPKTFKKEYQFHSFSHKYVSEFIKALNRRGIEGLLDPPDDNPLKRQSNSNDYFKNQFDPDSEYVVSGENDELYPKDNIDFSHASGYGLYNWEVFFHIPLMIAEQFSADQQYEEAQRWYHFIFDPTNSEDGTNGQFWKLKPFYDFNNENPDQKLSNALNNQNGLREQIKVWRENPFNPHAIARLRTVAYMKKTVFSYLDNLIAWGDQLFSRFTMESVNEATQLYVLAAEILGKKPTEIDKGSEGDTMNFQEFLNNQGLEPLKDLENELGPEFTKNEFDSNKENSKQGQNPLSSIMYFCQPVNDQALSYWDTVQDRLFKIRNCLNIEGERVSLSLFEPPISPAMLVKAASAGVDLGTVMGQLYAPAPIYRFRTMLEKAKEFCNEVKSLGNSLQTALEKKDSEELSKIRAKHEINLNEEVIKINDENIKNAELQKESLEKSKVVTEQRRDFYQNRKRRLSAEVAQTDKLNAAKTNRAVGQMLQTLGANLVLIPDLSGGGDGVASPVVEAKGGGNILDRSNRFAANALMTIASNNSTESSIAGTESSLKRRDEEWNFQKETAEKELEKIDKDLASTDVQIALAKKEKENQQTKIEQSEEVKEFMEDKFTNEELYNWMKGRLGNLYKQTYEMAYQMAKQAEKAYGFELGVEAPDFIGFGYWDNLHQGLLSGEKLYKDLMRMESAYMEENEREYELTKHFSIANLDPEQVLRLQETGVCDFDLPEVAYDMDHPSHYFRRIKSVKVTIPAVTGNYTNVTAKLTMVKNETRHTNIVSGDYNDPINYRENLTGIQSIATSSAENDSGLFQLNFNDERFLPFEGAGAISSWRLELPQEFPQFDYSSISDVILSVDYTAREGGELVANSAMSFWKNNFNDWIKDVDSLPRLFSLKSEFPTEFHQFLNPPENQNYHETTLNINYRHFSYFLKNWDLEINSLQLMVKPKNISAKDFTSNSGKIFSVEIDNNDPVEHSVDSFSADYDNNVAKVQFDTDINGQDPINLWTLRVNDDTDSDNLNSQIVDTDGKIIPEEIDDIMFYLEYSPTTKET